MNMEGETRCGFYVSPEKKKINAVYLELLTEFGRLCQQAGLTWWLFFGALIGAARHKGFIPWDDDVDLVMPRADFDRLRAMTSEEFGAREPYFLQNIRTDPTCVNAMLRFRRSDTSDIRVENLTYMRRHPGKAPYNMGLSLAVFPLDAVPESEFVRKLQRKAIYTLWGVFYRAHHPDEKKPLQHWVCSLAYRLIGGRNTMGLTHWLYRAPRRVRPDTVQCLDGLFSSSAKLLWPASDFQETVMLPFEDIEVPAPAGYDDILTITYGDYMQFPPPEKRVERHASHMDADRPYTELLPELLAGQDRRDE